jgi:hypothetical protein
MLRTKAGNVPNTLTTITLTPDAIEIDAQGKVRVKDRQVLETLLRLTPATQLRTEM